MSNRNFHFYRWLEVSGGKQFLWLYLYISPLFSHIVNILVQAFLTAYYEIFQTLAVDEDSCSWSRSWTSAVTISSGGNPWCQKIFPRFKKKHDSPRGPIRGCMVGWKNVPSCPAWQRWFPRHRDRTCWTHITSAPQPTTVCLRMF